MNRSSADTRFNQTLDWKQVTLKKAADGSFQGTVSSTDILSRDDFQYFVEVLTPDRGRRFPSYLDGQPYFVARVRRPELRDGVNCFFR